MRFEDQPLADARGQPTTTGNVDLLADKLFDDDPRISHLLAEVLQRQEDEIHRLQCISQQRQRDIQRQEDEIHKLREELTAFREEVALERAYDRQRISKLENPDVVAAPSEKTTEHIEHVKALLRQQRTGMTVKEIGQRLGVTRQRAAQICNEMENQGLVNVDWRKRPRHAKIIRLPRVIGEDF